MLLPCQPNQAITFRANPLSRWQASKTTKIFVKYNYLVPNLAPSRKCKPSEWATYKKDRFSGLSREWWISIFTKNEPVKTEQTCSKSQIIKYLSRVSLFPPESRSRFLTGHLNQEETKIGQPHRWENGWCADTSKKILALVQQACGHLLSNPKT